MKWTHFALESDLAQISAEIQAELGQALYRYLIIFSVMKTVISFTPQKRMSTNSGISMLVG